MIKVSHEIPIRLFPQHDFINDYPYALAHLLMKGTEHYESTYAKFYKAKLQTAEFSILDNSCYELGEPIDSHILYVLGEEYKPTHLVVPDMYQNMAGTVGSVFRYIEEYGQDSTPKFFAVVQGTTLEEYIECFDVFAKEPTIDIVGVNFKTLSDGKGRQDFLQHLIETGKDKMKKIHLLGCENASEFLEYSNEVMRIVHSVDTSAPIVHGWNLNKFTNEPFNYEKPDEKIAEHLFKTLNRQQRDMISHNVRMFRSFIH